MSDRPRHMKRRSSLAALLLLSAVAHAADAREPGQLETAASVCSMADACLPRILTALRHASTEADGSPLKRPPEALIPAFTRCGAIPLLESTSDGAMYVDESGDGGNGLPYSYSEEDVEGTYMPAAEAALEAATEWRAKATNHQPAPLARPPDGPQRRKRKPARRAVPDAQRWALQALYSVSTSSIRGKDTAVFGSVEPFWEAVLLVLGAASVTVVEYNPLLMIRHPKVVVRTPSDGALRLGEARFDAVLSLSAFDHDGLGRYGDPISPDGDLLTMDWLRGLVRPGTGILLLSVPVGPDGVFWNLHRRYGVVRLPLLLSGWELLQIPTSGTTRPGGCAGGGGRGDDDADAVGRVGIGCTGLLDDDLELYHAAHYTTPVGWDASRLSDEKMSPRRSYEPVFVLQLAGLDSDGSAAHHSDDRQCESTAGATGTTGVFWPTLSRLLRVTANES